MNEPNEQQEISIISGVRDNLLKPMAAEICSKISTKVETLRSFLIVNMILLLINLFTTVLLLIFLFRK